MVEKIFTSLYQVRKHYFPQTYEKERQERIKEREIEEMGFGKYLAKQILEGISRQLNK